MKYASSCKLLKVLSFGYTNVNVQIGFCGLIPFSFRLLLSLSSRTWNTQRSVFISLEPNRKHTRDPFTHNMCTPLSVKLSLFPLSLHIVRICTHMMQAHRNVILKDSSRVCICEIFLWRKISSIILVIQHTLKWSACFSSCLSFGSADRERSKIPWEKRGHRMI